MVEVDVDELLELLGVELAFSEVGRVLARLQLAALLLRQVSPLRQHLLDLLYPQAGRLRLVAPAHLAIKQIR